MNLEQVNDSLFCRVYQVNSVYIVKILDRKTNGIPYGEPDVKLVSLTGETQMITRKELMARFKTLNGKKIKMRSLRNEQWYCVLGNEHPEQFALKVPYDKTIEYGFNTNVAKPGSWLICSDDGMGGINKQIAVCMNSEQFKKIFKVTRVHFVEEFKRLLNGESLREPVSANVEFEVPDVIFNDTALWEVVARVNSGDSIKYKILHDNGEDKIVGENILKKMIRNDEVKEMSYNEGANSYIGWNKLNRLPMEDF